MEIEKDQESAQKCLTLDRFQRICLWLSTITRHMRCFQVEDDAKIELITTKDAINPPKQECIVHKFPVCVCVWQS